MIFAAGKAPTTVLLVGSTMSVEGATPKVQASVAVFTVSSAMVCQLDVEDACI